PRRSATPSIRRTRTGTSPPRTRCSVSRRRSPSTRPRRSGWRLSWPPIRPRRARKRRCKMEDGRCVNHKGPRGNISGAFVYLHLPSYIFHPPSRLPVRRRLGLVPVRQLFLPRALQILHAAHVHVLRDRGELERVAAPHHHVGFLAHLQRADAIRDPEHFSRHQRDGLQRIVPRHAVRDGVARLVTHVASVVVVLAEAAAVADDYHLHAGAFQNRQVLLTVTERGERARDVVHRARHHRHVRRGNFLRRLPCFRSALDHELEAELLRNAEG